jgi:hypothetical protein
MKLIIIGLCLFCLNAAVQAQQLSRSIVNTNGNAYTLGLIRVQVSVGEPIIGGTHAQLQQGFLCGLKKAKADSNVVVPKPDSALFRYFPNPVSDQLYFSGTRINIRYIQLSDIAGRRLATLPVQQQSVSLRAIPAGVYICTALNGAGEWLQSFKLIKL